MQSVVNFNVPQYKSLGLFLLCLAFIAFVFQDALSGLFSLWLVFDETYGHGLLVAATSLFLTFRALNVKRYDPISPNWYYALPLLLLSMLLEVAAVIGVELVQYLLLPVIILLSFALVAGTGEAKRIVVPLGLLYFAIPLWDHLNNALLALTTVVVQYLVQLSGITAHITGNSIFIPSGEIMIVSGCSGIRYFIIGSFLGVLGSYLNCITLKRQLLLITAAVFLSLLANWVRVYIIILIAYFSEMQSPLVDDHEMLGWVVFLLFILPLLILSSRYSSPGDTGGHTQAADNSPGQRLYKRPAMELAGVIIGFAVLWLSISAAPYMLDRYEDAGRADVKLSDVSSSFGGGRTEETEYIPLAYEWQPQISVPEDISVTQYGQDAGAVTVYRFLYLKGKGRGEILPYINNIYGRADWAVKDKGELGGYQQLRLVNKNTQEEVRVVYRFDVGGFTTSSYSIAKLYQFLAVANGRPYALFTAASTACQADCGPAYERLAVFTGGR
ncbi:exosortase [Methylohalomonas lacus]|uniref:Exosortase n=1 Tax=Methylohalomonas lacus TaxID=398773 RepID=A0AAE3L5Z5_9GAMM|nr:exosortase [Methylohalomonas lacus]MCS3904332.1 exosortase [Methylohalomonas lacus]